jgi:hypothetical protein
LVGGRVAATQNPQEPATIDVLHLALPSAAAFSVTTRKHHD